MKYAVIFDMDGVIIDTPKYVWKTHNKILSKYKKHVPDKDVHKYLGISLKDQISLLMENFRINVDIEEYKKEFLKEHEKHFDEFQCAQHLTAFLADLDKNKIPYAVATSNAKKRAEKFLKHLTLYDRFKAIITGDDVSRRKPNPDVFIAAAKALDVDPINCAVIEDAKNGIEAAKSAKMKVIAFKTNYQDSKQLADADLIINDFSELSVDVINDLLKN